MKETRARVRCIVLEFPAANGFTRHSGRGIAITLVSAIKTETAMCKGTLGLLLEPLRRVYPRSPIWESATKLCPSGIILTRCGRSPCFHAGFSCSYSRCSSRFDVHDPGLVFHAFYFTEFNCVIICSSRTVLVLGKQVSFDSEERTTELQYNLEPRLVIPMVQSQN